MEGTNNEKIVVNISAFKQREKEKERKRKIIIER
jgi:hypothetical protein